MKIARRFHDKYGLKLKAVKTRSHTAYRVYQVLSSDGKSRYKVVDNGKGVWNCNCKGFKYRNKCRHIDEAKDEKRRKK